MPGTRHHPPTQRLNVARARPPTPRAAAGASFMRASSTCGRQCEACGLDYAFIDSADGPAIFIIMIAGGHRGGLRADRRGEIPAAVLAARGAVAAADSRPPRFCRCVR